MSVASPPPPPRIAVRSSVPPDEASVQSTDGDARLPFVSRAGQSSPCIPLVLLLFDVCLILISRVDNAASELIFVLGWVLPIFYTLAGILGLVLGLIGFVGGLMRGVASTIVLGLLGIIFNLGYTSFWMYVGHRLYS
jgi:hypothetical protein